MDVPVLAKCKFWGAPYLDDPAPLKNAMQVYLYYVLLTLEMTCFRGISQEIKEGGKRGVALRCHALRGSMKSCWWESEAWQ